MYFNRKNAQQKNWRMIKKGKHFLFGCSLVFAIGATLAAPTVKADSVEDKPETTVPTSSESTGESTTYDAPAVTASVEKNTADVATVVSTETETAPSSPLVDKTKLEVALGQARAKSLDGQEAAVKAEVAAAIAEAEALVANGSASQEQVNQSVERLNQAVASVKEVTEAVAETTEAAAEATTDSSNTPKVRNRRAVEGSVRSVDETNLQRAVVTKENFESFFQEGGTATYDKSTGTIKLTDDVSGQVGSAYLRFKINSGEAFTFTGKVDIGNKYEGHTVDGRPGGDGVGFVFHTGKVDTIGQSGASIGMGTIKNAFGFKLDSWHNTSNPNANQNASADPKYGGNAWRTNAFGSFYSSNAAGRVTTSSSAAKALNPAPSGEWVDFKIEYDKDKNFTVTYGSQTWTTNLKNANTSIMTVDAKNALTKNNPTFALSFLGSTGSGTNLQRVQIERFEFTAPQIVHMKFVDVNGNEIEASSAIPGDENEVVNLSTQDKKIAAVEAKGYKLKEIDSSKAPSYIKENNTVKLTPGGQLLTYVFEEKDTTAPDAPVVNPVKAGDEAITGKAEAGS
ncbi:KxYKxGKxW signal peptide domain-containing protein, partial [Streptococcus australis]|uniref:lectin-like domain-containing protein n=1 Tax=Streptococcus australis TaxID=113107 RepID=UPI001CBFEAC6